ncbi:hypothetical protein NQ314_008041 [Rhamnusium bicolor]|uniref:HTH psq-type domain-containing protein n=1 Tax=Rhamnusium bicolor TaxID=1586634 RepID=A0AAV8YFE1_9CUCU|nr:hypothetical protein NQ314_008041 [Rhamnusium bicolor]
MSIKMVRNYKRKTQRASQYSQDDLATAVAEIKRGVMTIYQAHKLYNIPKTTLLYHVNGARGMKSKYQGRPPLFELKMRNGWLRVLRRWNDGDLVFLGKKSYI